MGSRATGHRASPARDGPRRLPPLCREAGAILRAMAHTRPRRRTVLMLAILLLFLAPILARAALFAASDAPRSWRDADWSSSGLLPAAADFKPARVIVFTGKAGAWKGIFAVHSWIVLKPAGARAWTRYDVVGWGSPVRTNGWPADGRWYGNTPVAIADVSGPAAEAADPEDRGRRRGLSLRQIRRLPHLAGAEQQQLHRGDPARGAGTRRQPAAQCGRPRLPRPASMPDRPTAAPAWSSICTGSPRSRSAGSRASRSTCSGWWPGSICAIRASSCRATAASAWHRRSPRALAR